MTNTRRTYGIGDRSEDGLLEIVDTRWDGNGTMFVSVRMLGRAEDFTHGFPVRRARTLARRALSLPENTRSSRVTRRWTYGACDYATFAVSRLKP